MSGHSKWATTKRQKAVVDAKRGALFTKIGNHSEIFHISHSENIILKTFLYYRLSRIFDNRKLQHLSFHRADCQISFLT